MATVEENKLPAPMITAILVLLIAVAALGLLTAKKHLVREPTISPAQNDITQFTELVNKYPNDPEIRSNLAYALQRNGQFKEAKEQYLEVLALAPKHLAALYNLGVIAKEENNPTEAKKHFDELLKLKKDHVLGVIGLSEVYIANGQYDEAISLLDPVIESQRTITNLRLLKGQALEKKGDKAGARAEYEAVLKFIPSHQEALDAVERLK